MMREHIPDRTRIHYVITNGGKRNGGGHHLGHHRSSLVPSYHDQNFFVAPMKK
jgi:hypothetical protein